MTGEPLRCGLDHCITCADEGIPMTVLRVDERRGLALCAGEDGARQSVETALVESVAPGDRLLVHAGTAIAALDAANAQPEVTR
jgi:hydrogenase assembly chaperone HypC/HupF